jgi:hypothetical protein
MGDLLELLIDWVLTIWWADDQMYGHRLFPLSPIEEKARRAKQIVFVVLLVAAIVLVCWWA